MQITHLELRNWRNFKHVDIDVGPRLFVFGPNASGKSNLLDAFRFLQDLTLDGGGLQKAVRDRGGMKRIRNLAARNFNKSRVLLSVALGDDSMPLRWEYELTCSNAVCVNRSESSSSVWYGRERTGAPRWRTTSETTIGR